MKILKSIQYTAFALLICAANIYAQDFKIAPSITVPQGSNFFNPSVASDQEHGFLVTWQNEYYKSNWVYSQIYACRISETGEMLDSSAIDLGVGSWPAYSPKAVFAGGNWVIVSTQGGMLEWVGVQRLTPSGEVLDSSAVNVCNSIGWASLTWPTIATNGQENLCVMSCAGCNLYGSIFDSDLNILVDRFLIYDCKDLGPSPPQISVNGNNFFVTFNLLGIIKLVVVSPQGQILSTQEDVSIIPWPSSTTVAMPTITTVNDTSYVAHFTLNDWGDKALWIRRYSADGSPIDLNPIKIIESQDFLDLLDEYTLLIDEGQTDLIWTKKYFCFFWPGVSNHGISMWKFCDLSTINQPIFLNSQCQIFLSGPTSYRYVLIRSSSLGNKVLTAWTDGREDSTRIYGNFFDVDEYTGIEQKENMIPENFSISQNYPNPFNSSTTIKFGIQERATVKLFVYDITGRLISMLVNEARDAGYYTVCWDGMDFMGKPVASGVYFSRFEVITQDKKLYNKVRKIILIR